MAKLLVLYIVLYTANNCIWYKHPENQQHPTELKRYLKHTVKAVQQRKATLRRTHSPILANKEFIAQMAQLENPDGNNQIVNSGGYMGKFQMGHGAFKSVGLNMSPRKFKRQGIPEKEQDMLFLKFCAVNRYYLQSEIRKYEGKRIRGIRMSEANIIAGAHLGGPNSVKRYLSSKGRCDFADGNGTRVSHYFRKFEHHQLDWRGVPEPKIIN